MQQFSLHNQQIRVIDEVGPAAVMVVRIAAKRGLRSELGLRPLAAFLSYCGQFTGFCVGKFNGALIAYLTALREMA